MVHTAAAVSHQSEIWRREQTWDGRRERQRRKQKTGQREMMGSEAER